MLKDLFRRYTPSQYLNIFLFTIFPQHTWTIYMVFRDLSWIAESNSTGDAVGVFGYAMLFALFESLIIFILILLFAILLPKQIAAEKRLALVYIAILVIFIWAVVSQLPALYGYQIPGFYSRLVVASGHPLWVLYGTALAGVGLSILIPAILWLKRPRLNSKILAVIERITILAWFYLFLDFVGIVIVIFRNLA